MSLIHEPPHRFIYAINNRQDIVHGRYLGRRRGYLVALQDARGIVRTFHPRYVGIDWGAFYAAQDTAR